MKIWGNEFHLMFVTDATAVYYGDDEGSPIDHIRWEGYIYGVNKKDEQEISRKLWNNNNEMESKNAGHNN